MPELAQFVQPVMQGSVHQMKEVRFQTATAEYSGSITLIARRSAKRPGVRHWRRGVAPDVRTYPTYTHAPARPLGAASCIAMSDSVCLKNCPC
jgi:hypothetical protein